MGAILCAAASLIIPSNTSQASPNTFFDALNMVRLNGDPSPQFVLPMLDGTDVRLADFKGSVVFLNFWATYCQPCRSEMASIQTLHEKFDENDLVVLAISVGEPAMKVERYLSKQSFTFPILLDKSKTVARKYGVNAVPTTLLIDRQGRLIAKALGPRNWASTPAFSIMSDLVKEAVD